MGTDQRNEKMSLQISTEFDAREVAAIGGGTDYNCEAGTLTKVDGAPARIGYYCRAVYNPTAGSISVKFKIFGDTETYTAAIPSGLWYKCYGNIQTIVSNGSTDCSVVLAYSKRVKVDGSGF